jgi:hypothetical protein
MFAVAVPIFVLLSKVTTLVLFEVQKKLPSELSGIWHGGAPSPNLVQAAGSRL